MKPRSVALQGVGDSAKSLATQGYTPSEARISRVILYAPYLTALSLPLSVEMILERAWVETLSHTAFYSFALPLKSTISQTSNQATSAMTDFFIKKGDTLPRIESTLKYSTGMPVDLTGATSVELVYRSVQNSLVTTKTGVIVDAIQGKVAYAWVEGDTSTPGSYQAEWKITFSGGGKLTIPNDATFVEFKIMPTLG